MFALPKWLTDIKKLFGSADGKVLGRVAGAWVFVSSFAPSAHKSSHATGGSDELAPADIGAASAESEHTHSNVTALAKVGESNGLPTWDGGGWPGSSGGDGSQNSLFVYTHLKGGL